MRTAADPDGPAPQSVVGRVLALLTAFRPGDAELTLAELHRRTGIAKPTAHRLLAELSGWDMVERTPTGIRLGMRLFELGQLVPGQRGLLDAAAPFLADLFEATLETVHLAVPDGVEVVYVQKLDGRRGPRVPSRVGGACRCTAPAWARRCWRSGRPSASPPSSRPGWPGSPPRSSLRAC